VVVLAAGEAVSAPRGWSQDGDDVVLRMSEEDYASLLLALGMTAGSLARDCGNLSGWLAFANRLNAGNPQWTPYGVAPETT